MKEFFIDNEYKLVNNNPDRNVWEVYKNDELLPKYNRLYKFYPLTIYSLDILLRNYFFLSDPGTFNDPFDCNINLIENFIDINKLETVKRNCFNNIGICCFSETIDNHLMWAHYTNNYSGFALEFDDIQVEINNQDYKQYALTRVIYPLNPPRISSNLPFSQQYLFSTKLKHWDYEKEWRIVTHLSSSNREMTFVKEKVKGIYIGHRVPDSNPGLYKFLLEIQELKFPDATIYVVYPHPNDLKLKFEKVWN